MGIYVAAFFVLTMCTMLFCTNVPKRVKITSYWLCAAGLILLSALRDFSIGADTIVYCQGYQHIRRLSFADAMKFEWEKGYVALNWVLGALFKNDRALLVFMACGILLPIFIWIRKSSQWPTLSLIVLVGMGMWNSSMFILRQWCAMAILTCSYKYIKQRRFLPFAALLLIAMLFHRTAAVFALAYFIMWIPISRKVVVFSVPFSILLGFAGNKALAFLNRFARIREAGNYNGGISMLVILWLCVIVTLIIFRRKIPSQLDLPFRLVFLAAFLQPLAFTFSNWARIVSYFSISLVVFLPNFVICITGRGTKNHKLRPALGMTICCLMMFWFGILGIEPYVFMMA